MIQKGDVVGWSNILKKETVPQEVGLVIQTNISIEGNDYSFAKVLWNDGNISNVPVKLIYVLNDSKEKDRDINLDSNNSQ